LEYNDHTHFASKKEVDEYTRQIDILLNGPPLISQETIDKLMGFESPFKKIVRELEDELKDSLEEEFGITLFRLLHNDSNRSVTIFLHIGPSYIGGASVSLNNLNKESLIKHIYSLAAITLKGYVERHGES
jgi:hypothetical protein